MTNRRLQPDVRRDTLLDHAVALAERDSYTTLTHQAIAAAAGVSQGLVVARLGTKAQILRDVMRRAVAAGNARVVAQGLARRDPHAMRADTALRERAAEWVRAA